MIKESWVYTPVISIKIYTSLCLSNLHGSNASNYVPNDKVLTDICLIYYASTTAIKTNRFWKKRDHGQKRLVLMAGVLA
jgi:hypothetical protein